MFFNASIIFSSISGAVLHFLAGAHTAKQAWTLLRGPLILSPCKSPLWVIRFHICEEPVDRFYQTVSWKRKEKKKNVDIADQCGQTYRSTGSVMSPFESLFLIKFHLCSAWVFAHSIQSGMPYILRILSAKIWKSRQVKADRKISFWRRAWARSLILNSQS